MTVTGGQTTDGDATSSDATSGETTTDSSTGGGQTLTSGDSSVGGASNSSTSSSGGSGGASSGGSAGTDGSAGGSGGTGGGATNTTLTSGSAGTGGNVDSMCQGTSQVDFALVGWASEAGGTSGGRGGDTISVSTGAELAEALKDKQDSSTPLTILVNGVITEANSGGVSKFDVKDVSDVSIIGTGSGTEFNGIGIKITRASNIIIRNLKIHHVLIGDKDAISIEGPADHIWIDHNELYADYQNVDKDDYDGLLDAKAEAEYITYSWNYLHDSWKTSLVGSSESDTFDRKITMHHNHYENCNSRLPLFRGGNGHLFNNLYEDIESTAINSRINACLRVEHNYFDNTHNPWVSAYSDVLGGVELSCNVTTGTSAFDYSDSDVSEPESCTATVPYAYDNVLNGVAAVPDIVRQNAGVGKLDDPTQF